MNINLHKKTLKVTMTAAKAMEKMMKALAVHRMTMTAKTKSPSHNMMMTVISKIPIHNMMMVTITAILIVMMVMMILMI